MEPVELFGIVFRSSSHMRWFIGTMVLLGEITVVSVIFMKMKLYMVPIILSGCFAVLSLVTSVAAIGVTKWGTINGPVWSADCIWYNALLGSLYFSATAFFGYRLLQQRKLTTTL